MHELTHVTLIQSTEPAKNPHARARRTVIVRALIEYHLKIQRGDMAYLGLFSIAKQKILPTSFLSLRRVTSGGLLLSHF